MSRARRVRVALSDYIESLLNYVTLPSRRLESWHPLTPFSIGSKSAPLRLTSFSQTTAVPTVPMSIVTAAHQIQELVRGHGY